VWAGTVEEAGEAARREFGLGNVYDVQDQKHAGLLRKGAGRSGEVTPGAPAAARGEPPRARGTAKEVTAMAKQFVLEPMKAFRRESSEAPAEPGTAHGEYGPIYLAIQEGSGYSTSTRTGFWRWCDQCGAWAKGVAIIG
jgi:hypothetical protein